MSFKVLMYHEIRSNIVQGLDIDVANGYQDTLPKVLYAQVECFKKQMLYLKQKNYYFMTLEDLINYYEGDFDLPKNSILITFDDGFQSQYYNAYPVLKELEIPAVMFYIGSWLFKTSKSMNKNTTRTMTHDQMNEIKDVFKLAHHTFDLHNRHEFLSYDLDTVKADFIRNQPFLDYDNVFAYPFGLIDDAMVEKMSNTGIKYAFTSDPGINDKSSDTMRLSRYFAHYDMDLESFVAMMNE